MSDRDIRNFFKRQLAVIFQQSAADPEGFRAYFADHEPKDEEILGLLAVTSMMSGEMQMGDSFPSPLEALAALSDRSRRLLCDEFRKELRHWLDAPAAA
jgi:hypothetical protein